MYKKQTNRQLTLYDFDQPLDQKSGYYSLISH